MKPLTFTKSNNLGKLHTEILVALPELGPEAIGGRNVAKIQVLGDGDNITIVVPDSFTNNAGLKAVIDAHINTPDPPVKDPQTLRQEALDRVEAQRKTATTVAQLNQVISSLISELKNIP